MTSYSRLHITTIAALAITLATTSSAAAVAAHAHRTHQPTTRTLSSYSVSTTMPAVTLDVAREATDPSLVASADEFYRASRFDAAGGMALVKPQVRVVTQFRTERSLVQTAPEVRFTPVLHPGARKVVNRGQPALEDVTQRVVLWDNVVVSAKTVNTHVVRKGRAGLVLLGAPMTWDQLAASSRFSRLLGVFEMEATAYTAWTATSHPTGRTATGMQAGWGIVAVDPHVIKLGSHVFIPGYGPAIAADTGGAIVGNRIDLCMESVRDALVFGRRPVKVYVLAE